MTSNRRYDLEFLLAILAGALLGGIAIFALLKGLDFL